MYISFIYLENIKSLRGTHQIPTSEGINVFVGKNNVGKSTVLKSIYQLQGYKFSIEDNSIDTYSSSTTIKLETNKDYYEFNNYPGNPYTKKNVRNVRVSFKTFRDVRGEVNSYSQISFVNIDGQTRDIDVSFDPYQQNTKKNLIFPFFSKRNIVGYNKSILKSDRERVVGDLSNLYAKIDFLSTSDRNVSRIYKEACENILGFFVGTDSDNEGKYAALAVDDYRSIPITSMGDGVPNILGLIADLCLAENKIFLIEEPENDIHPQALKALLKLIEEKSSTNQFFISTHSNIVVRYLGANPNTKLFQIEHNNNTENPSIPSSVINNVSNDPAERLKVLEDLGYDVFDYSLWKGWLFLEESSAETIINEFLIPNFAKGLQNRIKTFSTRGFDGIGDKFKNFSKIFIYAHLDTLYKNKAWVLIDAREKEKKEIDKLRKDFSNWNYEDHFRQLSKHNFEEYYPVRFQSMISEILSVDSSDNTSDKKQTLKKPLKENLLRSVRDWYVEDPVNAFKEFQASASELIDFLKEVERTLQ